MNLIAINLTLIEYIALPIVATIFGATIYFFIKSRQSLRETLESNKKNYLPKKDKMFSFQGAGDFEKTDQSKKLRHEVSHIEEDSFKRKHNDENLVQQLKSTIEQQQKMLNSYLGKVEEVENQGRGILNRENEAMQREIHKLHLVIEKKDEEMESLHQQASTASRMSSKIEEVYEEFDRLQEKLAALEKQAGGVNNLVIELENSKQAYEQGLKDLARKQEKLEDVMNENQKMRMEMDVLEDKLAEANLQRQQLQKKVQFLQELNADMQNISETNKKLQTELRRIGELESMLTMMAEERDQLLRKKSDK
jgi:chromosome segregation ATPase